MRPLGKVSGGRVSRRSRLSTIILVRHARSVANAEGVLAGQTPGVTLDSTGIKQSKELAQTLGPLSIAKVFVSPLQRCVDTITPWLATYGNGIDVHSEPRIIEPDYGLWSGKKLTELSLDPLWKDVQRNPETVQFPHGEKFIDVWNRVRSFYLSLQGIADETSNFIVVSHGDIIKFLIANILQLEFQKFQTLVVEPASVSIAQISKEESRLLQFNRSHEPLNKTIEALFSSSLGGEVRQNKSEGK